MSDPTSLTIGAAAGSRFGVVVVDAVETVDGAARVRCSVVGRDLVVAFGGKDWEHSTRPVVSRNDADAALAALDGTVVRPSEDAEAAGVLQRSHEISLGMDFGAKVAALRELQAVDGSRHPARDVLELELRQAIGSELGHVLGRDVDEVVAGPRS